MAQDYKTLEVEIHDDYVAVVTINRPEALNAFDLQMMTEFTSLWRALAEDDSVHSVVLRASEGRAFSPGVDVRKGENVQRSENVWNRSDPGEALGPKANRCWKPVVCAVHGMCAAGAFYWVNEADIVICSEEATFFDPHVTFGMIAALEPIGLTYRMPLGDVLRMALLGNDERIGAGTALRLGLVSEITKREALWERARELATKIAAKPAVATQGTVKAIWESLDLPRSTALSRGLVYPLLGKEGKAAVDRSAIMAGAKTYEVR